MWQYFYHHVFALDLMVVQLQLVRLFHELKTNVIKKIRYLKSI